MKITRTSGFTLIEICIVLIIVGIVMVPLFKMYDLYIKDQKRLKTLEAIDNSIALLGTASVQSLLCPSDRGLPPGDPNYMMERRIGNSSTQPCDLPAYGITGVGTCSPSGGICLVPGLRDVNNDTLIDDMDAVLIGGVPSISLIQQVAANQSSSTIYSNLGVDGYGNLLTYAVSVIMTDPGAIDDGYDLGNISLIDEFNAPTGGINGNADFVVLSHGMDGAGAFTTEGVIGTPCAGIGNSVDADNCDDTDATFRLALGKYEAVGNTYYDDYIRTYKTGYGNLWDNMTDPGTGVITTHVRNTTLGNVGVNMSTPSEQLEVNGNIRTSHYARSNLICSASVPTTPTYPGRCFDVRSITAPDAATQSTIDCSAGQIMMGLQTNFNAGTGRYTTTPQCRSQNFTATQPMQATCPTGTYISGFKEDGHLICTDGTICPGGVGCT